MQITETKKEYLFRRECDFRISEDKKEYFEVEEGLEVSFTRKDNGKYELCSVLFDKEWFDFEDADDYWHDIDFRLLTKKNDWNRKIPMAEFIIDVGGGRMVVGCYKDLPKYATLKEQFEELKAIEDDLEDDYDDELDGIDVAKHPKAKLFNKDNEYIREFMEHYDRTDESILACLGILNARTLYQEGIAPDTFAEQYGDEIIEFFGFFMENFYTIEFEEKMIHNWGDLPRIIRIAMVLGENILRESQNEVLREAVSSITGKRKRNAEKLAMYFLRDSEHRRCVSVITENFDAARDFVPGEEEENREMAYGLSAVLFKYGGACIFRTILNEDCHIVNGFRVLNGKPELISVKELKECMQLQPDKSILEFPEDRYQKAFIKFER